MKINKNLRQIIEDLYLPKEARQALKNGSEWERSPESIEECSPFVYWCDSCDTYHQVYYGFGVRIEDGKVFVTVHECDSDGNWEQQDEAEYGTPAAASLEREYSYEASRSGWQGYFSYVARTGEDPIGEFLVPTSRKVTRKWQVRLRQSLVGVVCVGARRNSRGEWIKADLLPDSLKEFLLLQKRGIVWTMVDDEIKQLDDVRKLVTPQRFLNKNELTFVCDVEEQLMYSDRRVKRQRQKLARKHQQEE